MKVAMGQGGRHKASRAVCKQELLRAEAQTLFIPVGPWMEQPECGFHKSGLP